MPCNAAWQDVTRDNAPPVSPTKCCKLQVTISGTTYGRILQWALVHHPVKSPSEVDRNGEPPLPWQAQKELLRPTCGISGQWFVGCPQVYARTTLRIRHVQRFWLNIASQIAAGPLLCHSAFAETKQQPIPQHMIKRYPASRNWNEASSGRLCLANGSRLIHDRIHHWWEPDSNST